MKDVKQPQRWGGDFCWAPGNLARECIRNQENGDETGEDVQSLTVREVFRAKKGSQSVDDLAAAHARVASSRKKVSYYGLPGPKSKGRIHCRNGAESSAYVKVVYNNSPKNYEARENGENTDVTAHEKTCRQSFCAPEIEEMPMHESKSCADQGIDPDSSTAHSAQIREPNLLPSSFKRNRNTGRKRPAVDSVEHAAGEETVTTAASPPIKAHKPSVETCVKVKSYKNGICKNELRIEDNV